MRELTVCCLTKFTFEYKDGLLRSDGFLGRREWGFFGIPWGSMGKFVAVGFKAAPGQEFSYEHFLGNASVHIIGPKKSVSGGALRRGISEIWGIFVDIMRQRTIFRDIDLVFSEFREYTFFEIVLIKLFARKAKTVVYFISDFPESNYARHQNLFFKHLLRIFVYLSQLVADDIWFISEHLARKYLFGKRNFGIVRPSNLEEKEIAIDFFHPFPGVPLRLLQVARLEREKRPEIVIKAVSFLKKSNIPVHLELVGEGALRKELRDLSEGLGLGKEIDFKGHIADRGTLLKSYRNADISLLASRHEGLGLVLIESLSQGVPVIAYRFEGVDEIIKEGEDGFLVDASDPESTALAMADKIKYLYENREVYEKMSKNGIKKSHNFTLERATTVQQKRLKALLGTRFRPS